MLEPALLDGGKEWIYQFIRYTKRACFMLNNGIRNGLARSILNKEEKSE
jgi:hypothetical protein